MLPQATRPSRSTVNKNTGRKQTNKQTKKKEKRKEHKRREKKEKKKTKDARERRGFEPVQNKDAVGFDSTCIYTSDALTD